MTKESQKDIKKIGEFRKADHPMPRPTTNSYTPKVREHFKDLFESPTEILYTPDLKGNFTSVNPAVEKILGYSRSGFLKLNLLERGSVKIKWGFIDLILNLFSRGSTEVGYFILQAVGLSLPSSLVNWERQGPW